MKGKRERALSRERERERERGKNKIRTSSLSSLGFRGVVLTHLLLHKEKE
jgi:hypothetical protein